MKKNSALITGATGGFGSAFARRLAAMKYDLILTDMDPSALNKMAETLQTAYPVSVRTEVVDLSDDKAIARFADKLTRNGAIDVLVNCAGFGEGIRFSQEKLERQLRMIQVHISAAVQLVHAVLPGMIRKRSGKIITISSLSAFLPAPGNSVYAGTKAFLNSFMESIHMEVSGYGIQVQSLCPGLTQTGFHEKLKQEGKRAKLNKVVPWMEAEEVVDYSFKCLARRRVICVPGCFNRTVRKSVPLVPRKSFYSIAKKFAGKNLK